MMRRATVAVLCSAVLFFLAACTTGGGTTKINVSSVDVTPAAVSVNTGDSVQLSVVVTGDAGVSQAVSWVSDDTGVAGVDASGLVTGIASGAATVTATSTADTSKSGSAVVTVVTCGATQELNDITVPTTLTGVAGCTDYLVNQSEVSVTAALTIQAGVTIAFQDGSRLDVETGGSVTANGTAAEPITFTGQVEVNGFWAGIRVLDGGSATFDGVTVSYGGSAGAAVLVGLGARASFVNSSFVNSENYGLSVEWTGDLDAFSGNTFSNNRVPMVVTTHNLVQLDSASTFAANNTENFIDISGGGTDASGTWPAAQTPYRLVSDHMDVAHAITIEDGAQFQFQANSRLDVYAGGSLTASGAVTGISFTGTTQVAGHWTGIRVLDGGVASFDGVTVSYGGGSGNMYAANLSVINGTLNLTDSTVDHSENYGLYVTGAAASVTPATESDMVNQNTFANNPGGNVFGLP